MADRVEGDPTPIPRGDDKNVGEPTPWTTWGFAGERTPSYSTDPRVQSNPLYQGMSQADTAKWYWEQMAESGQVIREQVRSYYPPDPRSTSMFDPMLLQAYTNNPQGFMETIYPLLTQNQQSQFAQVQRREVEVKNAEGAFGDPMSTPIAGRPAPKKDEKATGQQGAGGPQSLGPQSQKTVQDAVGQRDERKQMIQQTGGTFAPREIAPPTMPAQDTKGQAITPTNTPTVTLTPTTPSNTGAPPTNSPALAIQDNLPGRQGMGWAPADAVVANTPINSAGQTQTIGLSDFAVKQGSFNVAPYDAGASAPPPPQPTNAAPSVTQANTNPSFAGLTVGQQGYARGLASTGYSGPYDEAAINKYISGGGVQKYDQGGMIREPVVGQGQLTGATYTIAEKGPERVMPEGPYRTEIKLRSGHRISVGGSD